MMNDRIAPPEERLALPLLPLSLLLFLVTAGMLICVTVDFVLVLMS